MDEPLEINTEGGAAVDGDVATQGGAFTGRDAPANILHFQAPENFATTVLLHLSQINGTVSSLDAKLSALNEKVSGQGERLRGVEVKIDAVERDLHNLKGTTLQLQRISEDQLKAIEESKRHRAQLDSDIKALQGQVQKLPEKMPTPTPPEPGLQPLKTWQWIVLAIFTLMLSLPALSQLIQWIN